MNLFEKPKKSEVKGLSRRWKTPLADRMRPKNLDEFMGQKHILKKDSVLRKAIEKGELQFAGRLFLSLIYLRVSIKSFSPSF